MIRLLQLGRRFKWTASIDKAFGLKWTEGEKKKSFKCRATLKQSRASAKELEWRQDCFFASKCNLNHTKDKLQLELLCWNQSITQMLGSSSNKSRWITREWKYGEYESTSLTAQIKESTIGFVCCMLQPQPQKDQRWRVQTCFLLFYMNYKNTIGDKITHKLLFLLDTSMSQYIFLTRYRN